ncbi:mycofactocin-coupled SDR family oxidoreductase [Pseudonocardia eucalypti]|uniref:Mycofactocin-coupled SDR family oxidoreductase n=1 Tax=Pseudonocardia eucalypti TaxID=648755 RepID=A0ABP9PNG4_9PSEU|nr:(+)-trans-carveol dehydrogenase [Pseudonocardia eucalypti]
MTGRVEGKVAFVTGVARGQGRSHAVRLAQEGADIIGIDLCDSVDTVPYPGATKDDLAETRRQIEELDRRAVLTTADVRSLDEVSGAVENGVAELGRLDVVVANAGIFSAAAADQMSEQTWLEMISVNLTGVWWTCRATIPHLIAGNGGSIILTSSRVGYASGSPNLVHYSAAKSGVVGMMKSLSVELAKHSIRVNTVNPTNCDTPMLRNDFMKQLFFPDRPDATEDDFIQACRATHNLPIPWVDPIDISNAVLYLASEEARYVTGVSLSVGEV